MLPDESDAHEPESTSTEDAPGRNTLTVTLNLPHLLGRLNRRLEEISRFVSIALLSDGNAEDQQGPTLTFNFQSGLDWSPDQQKLAWQSWVLRNAFRDVAELISGVLEEAEKVLSVFALLDKQQRGEVVTVADYKEMQKQTARFHRSSLSDKLAWLRSQPNFEIPQEKIDEINSINVARNCLTHRSGTVGRPDVKDEDSLVVKWLGMDAFVQTDGTEIPLTFPMYVEKGGTVSVRIVRRTKEFKLGQAVLFTDREFSEISLTLFAFAKAVATALEQAGKVRGIAFSPDHAEEKPAGD